MKRTANSSPWESKRRRSTDIQAYLDQLLRIQESLGALDKACALEQIQIQRKFDTQKTPLIETRREALDCIPGFWGKAIMNHPDVKTRSGDSEILNFLEDVHLIDNEDDNGSHTISLRWGERNIFFPEKQIKRVVKIGNDDVENVTNSQISWAPGKKPEKGSFFDFFSTDLTDECDFGEILRRDLWINPYPYFMNISPPEFSAPE